MISYVPLFRPKEKIDFYDSKVTILGGNIEVAALVGSDRKFADWPVWIGCDSIKQEGYTMAGLRVAPYY